MVGLAARNKFELSMKLEWAAHRRTTKKPLGYSKRKLTMQRPSWKLLQGIDISRYPLISTQAIFDVFPSKIIPSPLGTEFGGATLV